MTKRPTLTTSAGARSATIRIWSLQVCAVLPLLQDYQLIEKLAHQNRERIPERTVHAKGRGAHGTFTVTRDITKFTKTKIFSEVAKKTQMLARFSTVAGELGAGDAERDVRGFALKFYTEEGNWDLVGNNTPIFFIRDSYKFPQGSAGTASEQRRRSDAGRAGRDRQASDRPFLQGRPQIRQRRRPAHGRHGQRSCGSATTVWCRVTDPALAGGGDRPALPADRRSPAWRASIA
jgi:hypothetical protein